MAFGIILLLFNHHFKSWMSSNSDLQDQQTLLSDPTYPNTDLIILNSTFVIPPHIPHHISFSLCRAFSRRCSKHWKTHIISPFSWLVQREVKEGMSLYKTRWRNKTKTNYCVREIWHC